MRELTLEEIEAVSGAGFWGEFWGGINSFLQASADFLGFDGHFGYDGGRRIASSHTIFDHDFGGSSETLTLNILSDGTEEYVLTATRDGDDSGYFILVGSGAYGVTGGVGIGPSADDNFDVYAYTGIGTPGFSVFLGETNSASGFIEGLSVTGAGTLASGLGVDPATGMPNGANGVGFGNPGLSVTYGFNLDEFFAPIGADIANGVYRASTDSSYDPYIPGPDRVTPYN